MKVQVDCKMQRAWIDSIEVDWAWLGVLWFEKYDHCLWDDFVSKGREIFTEWLRHEVLG